MSKINPDHYKSHPSKVECIEITRHENFNCGNAIKYIWRRGEKGCPIEDLQKAAWYIQDEIARLKGCQTKPGGSEASCRECDARQKEEDAAEGKAHRESEGRTRMNEPKGAITLSEFTRYLESMERTGYQNNMPYSESPIKHSDIK